MYQGIIDLTRLMINHPEETLDVKIIHDWAEDWQEIHQKFHFHKVPVFASTDLGMGDDLRILSKSMAWMCYDGSPSYRDRWIEFGVTPGFSPAQSLVMELWSLWADSDQGLSFERGDNFTGPEERDDEALRFVLANVCDEHWREIADLNNKLLDEAGFQVSED
jgi:hypothetical protein